jgi:predicted alpha/beta hydrolase family esterase
MTYTPHVFVLPGLGGSEPEHWQTRWEDEHGYVRVQQRDWDRPEPNEWMDQLERVLAAGGTPCVLVAHSLGCALVAHFVRELRPTFSGIRGALLVAPADVDDQAHTPEVVRGFAPLPLEPLPFPSIVVASTNDPYVSLARAREFADRWGADFVDIGAAGHINAESQLGAWPEGHRVFERLLERL